MPIQKIIYSVSLLFLISIQTVQKNKKETTTMKRYYIFFLLIFGFTISSDASPTYSYQYTFPPKIQDFLNRHFNQYEIEKLKYGAKDGDCKVKYKNGIKVEFNHHGDWEEIESDYAPLPKSIIDILPKPAVTFIAKKYPRRPIIKVKHQSREYKVKLEGSLELKFDDYGNIIKIDD